MTNERIKNKELINKLKNNAELAMAAYGYFHLAGKKFKDEDEYPDDKRDKPITLHDILDSTYKGYITPDHSRLFNPEKLNGDFTPTQAKKFFDKYDLLDFYPKLDTKNNKQKKGFHACLFQDKKSKEYIFAIRGTEKSSINDIRTDGKLALSGIPKKQYIDTILFYNQCIRRTSFLCR